MVEADFYYQTNSISQVKIKGHAKYAEYGQDIVCAGVSAIVIGTLNALREMVAKSEVKIQQFEQLGQIIITVIKATTNNQIILNTMFWQLKTAEASYSQYIKVREDKNEI